MRTNTLHLLLVGVVTLCAVGESRSQSAGDLFRACTGIDKAASIMCGMYMTGFVSGLTYEQAARGTENLFASGHHRTAGTGNL